jgi:hypothetical protein
MRGLLDTVFYALTAPIRLFGRSSRLRLAIGALAIVALFYSVTLWALDRFLPPADGNDGPALTNLPQLPPLQPLTRASYVIAPVAISLNAIGRSLDAAAPRDLVGKDDNPVSSLLSKADIGITVSRGSMSVSGKPNELTVLTPLNGNLNITGQIAGAAGGVVGGIAGLLDSGLGKGLGKITNQVLDQKAEIRGQVTVRSRPALTANWRLQPNLSSQLSLSNTTMQLAGVKIDVGNEAKPLIDKTVNQQVAALENRLRNDPVIERTARAQWAKMCRSIPLGGGKTGLPELWLEMRPVRAAAAQPQIDAKDVTLTVGVQADTRIVPAATKPSCPFPAQLELVPPMDKGKLSVGLPIDMPFTELNKLLEAQLKGKNFPEDNSGSVGVEVLGVKLGAIQVGSSRLGQSTSPISGKPEIGGDRLLISLLVKARERKSWFGFGAQATVQIWGKPELDAQRQILRLTDLSMAVESEAAFGLLGAAARAAMPYVQKALADKAQIDLKPFAADAKTKISAALADFQNGSPGVRVDAKIDEVRLTGIAFDSSTLRVIAEAAGVAKVAVSELPKM